MDAASRVAQDERLALALVPFHLLVTGDPVRGMQGIREAATSDAVSCVVRCRSALCIPVLLNRAFLNEFYNFQAIRLMVPGALGTLGVVAVSLVALDESLALVLVCFLLIAVEEIVRVLNWVRKAATFHVVSCI